MLLGARDSASLRFPATVQPILGQASPHSGIRFLSALALASESECGTGRSFHSVNSRASRILHRIDSTGHPACKQFGCSSWICRLVTSLGGLPGGRWLRLLDDLRNYYSCRNAPVTIFFLEYFVK